MKFTGGSRWGNFVEEICFPWYFPLLECQKWFSFTISVVSFDSVEIHSEVMASWKCLQSDYDFWSENLNCAISNESHESGDKPD